jgi:hypothetical protein
MITYNDIKELEKSFKNKKSTNVIKNTIYVFTGIIVLYIIIASI